MLTTSCLAAENSCLAPGGVYRAADVSVSAGRSYRSGSTLPSSSIAADDVVISCGSAMAVKFLWHFPSGHPDRPLAGTLVIRSPDFPPVSELTGVHPSSSSDDDAVAVVGAREKDFKSTRAQRKTIARHHGPEGGVFRNLSESLLAPSISSWSAESGSLGMKRNASSPLHI